jgi:translocation and assembly module TamB
MTRLRLIIALLILLVAFAFTWLLASESGLRWAYQLTRAYLPAELQVKQLSGKLIGPIRLGSIEYQQDGTLIKTGAVVFDWQPASLLTADFKISRLSIQSLEIVLPETETATQTPGQDIILPEIKLPLRIIVQQANIDDISLRQGEQVYTLNTIRLDTSTVSSKISVEKLSISADSSSLVLNGIVQPDNNYHHELNLDWQARLPSGAVITGHGQVTGDASSTHLTQQLSGALQLTLDAQLKNLLGKLNWQAKLAATQFDSAKLDAALPALSGRFDLDAHGDISTAVVSGTLAANSAAIGAFDASFKLQATTDKTIQIDSLRLHAAASNTVLNLSGHVVPGNSIGNVDLALNWKNLRWPMQGASIFNSASGSGTINGSLDAYRIKLSSDSPWQDLLPSTWQATATGNTQGLDIQSLRVRALNGVASAKGQLSWSPAFSWKADIDASNIDPASLWPAWRGQLRAKLSTHGDMQKGVLHAEANIHYIEGTLRGYPVSLRSQMKLRGDKLNIHQLNVHSGDSTFTLQGQATETLSLNWAFASNDLAELYPQASGQFHAEGTIKGPRETPEVAASVDGQALKLADYTITKIAGNLAVDLFRWQAINIDLAAESLILKEYALQTLAINTDADHMQLTAVSSLATTDIEIQGEVYANGWRGRITRAEMQSTQLDHWQLTNPVALDISEKNFVADKLCWHSNKDASLCLALKQNASTWHGSVAARQLPLQLFTPWLPPELKLEGVADASAELDYRAPDQLLGEVKLTLSPGAVSYPLLEGERELWRYSSGRLNVALTEKEIKASSELALNNGDQINAWLKLPQAQLLNLDSQTQTLAASAQLSVHDLGFIEALVPEIQDLTGEAKLNVSLSGTLAQPRLKGHAQLTKGALRIPGLGLSIDQITLKSQSDGFEKINFSLTAHSGDGDLAVTGQTLLDSEAGWPTEISIKGNDFEVARIPEARVLVSPELAIKLQDHDINISGKIHVPYAKLQPKDTVTAVHVSDDAVIVGGEQNLDKKWAVHTRVRVTLGERVNFYGYGFEGRLSGNLLIEDEPGQLTRATGEISIPEGRYRAYGQRLDVEHGRLLFTGGPLTNPGLDLRAVRRVNNVTAGIRVRGSLNRPVLELFSVPSMGETDALSYLLLGRPLENASSEEGAMMAKATLALGLSGGDSLVRKLGDRFGFDEMRLESSENSDQASLVVGRYLSPKVYVSYGVGLIEAFNTFTVRYQISKNWQLKAESGAAQGADLLYIFER